MLLFFILMSLKSTVNSAKLRDRSIHYTIGRKRVVLALVVTSTNNENSILVTYMPQLRAHTVVMLLKPTKNTDFCVFIENARKVSKLTCCVFE